MNDTVTVLGIESSCDETAAAVVRQIRGAAPEILSEVVRSQDQHHAPYGGVVPEIAARAHASFADEIVAKAMDEAGIGYADLDGVAATSGPGLIGGVMVGMMTGKAIAMAAGKPFVAINHLEGHALSPRLTHACNFPYLLLLVSGGHCQFIAVKALGEYQRLGTTIDDAAGEAFDKLARELGLGFPGGPAVERAAHEGNPEAYDLPRPLLDRDTLDFSFAGLKTAAARLAAQINGDLQARADLCASFQAAVADCLASKSRRALQRFGELHVEGGEVRFVVAGGVAANQAIRHALQAEADRIGARFIAPPLRHCTDNAAMIALAGAERLLAYGGDETQLAFQARSRWPLDIKTANENPAYGGGKRGAKA